MKFQRPARLQMTDKLLQLGMGLILGEWGIAKEQPLRIADQFAARGNIDGCFLLVTRNHNHLHRTKLLRHSWQVLLQKSPLTFEKSKMTMTCMQ